MTTDKADQTSSHFEEMFSKAKEEQSTESKEQLTMVTIEIQVQFKAKDHLIQGFEGKFMDSQHVLAHLANKRGAQKAKLEQQLHNSAKNTIHYKGDQSLQLSQGLDRTPAIEINYLSEDLEAVQDKSERYNNKKISDQLSCQPTTYQQKFCNLHDINTHSDSNQEMDEMMKRVEKNMKSQANCLKSCHDKVATLEALTQDLRSTFKPASSSTRLKEATDCNAQLKSKLVAESQSTLESQAKVKKLLVTLHTLERELADAPTKYQLKEATDIGAQLKSELAKEKEHTAQAKARITTLEASIGELQEELARVYTYKIKLAHTLNQLQEVEQKSASLEKGLTRVSAALTEQQSNASDLQKRLAAAPTLDQLAEIESRKNSLEVKLADEISRGLEYQNQILVMKDSICKLEKRLISAPSKAQFEELGSTKKALEASLSKSTLILEEKQAEVITIQTKLNATLTRYRTLEAAKLEVEKYLSNFTKASNSEVSSLKAEIKDLKENLKSAPTSEKVGKLQETVDSRSQCLALVEENCHQAEEKLAALTLEYKSSLSNIKRELLEIKGHSEHLEKENAVCRRIIMEMTTSALNASHQKALKLAEAREKELLLKVVTLFAQLEDRSYKTAYKAAIAHSEKLSRELTEAKLSAACKISALNHEKNLLIKEMQAHQSLNSDIAEACEATIKSLNLAKASNW
ncbi:hypothetical protein L0F63_001628, partial [Massospora cicadina]